jgi:hypothetical protein
MSDPFEPWPNQRLIAPEAGFFKRALAVAVSTVSSLRGTMVLLPRPEGHMGSMGPLDEIEGSIRVDPTFKLVFVSAVALTLLVLAVWVVVAMLFDRPTEAARSLTSGCETLTKIGFGTVLGLLGGKTTPPPKSSRPRLRVK